MLIDPGAELDRYGGQGRFTAHTAQSGAIRSQHELFTTMLTQIRLGIV